MSPDSISACALPSEYSYDKDNPWNSTSTYKDYVRTLCTANPSLLSLHTFLTNPKARDHGCHATALDFQRDPTQPIVRQIPTLEHLLDECRGKVSEVRGEGRTKDHLLFGRILIFEDLTVNVIQLLGIELDLDPLFFATHLHTVHRTGMRHQTPDDAILPSRLHGSNYVNVSYHQPVTSDVAFPSGGKYTMDSAIDRKLVFLRATSIGLAQHRVSVIKLRRTQNFWLAVVLVDPPLGAKYFRSEYKDNLEHQVNLCLRPYLGTYENFMPLPRFSGEWAQKTQERRGGMLNELIHYWTTAVPECFDRTDPSIQALAYYPLRIVAAEWVKYIAVMQHCIKMYEYEGSQLDLEKFNMDLRELQGWRRRSMISQKKIRVVIRHLQSHESHDSKHNASIDRLLDDYMLITEDIEDAGRRLENMLPVVTSLVQIIDARQSFAETANISRLTVLALIFVPLSYVSSLFSMNSENMPGSKRFWVYFAVAIPVTFVVFFIARPPTRDGILRTLLRWFGIFERKTPSPILGDEPKHVADAKKEDWVQVRTKTMRM